MGCCHVACGVPCRQASNWGQQPLAVCMSVIRTAAKGETRLGVACCHVACGGLCRQISTCTCFVPDPSCAASLGCIVHSGQHMLLKLLSSHLRNEYPSLPPPQTKGRAGAESVSEGPLQSARLYSGQLRVEDRVADGIACCHTACCRACKQVSIWAHSIKR